VSKNIPGPLRADQNGEVSDRKVIRGEVRTETKTGRKEVPPKENLEFATELEIGCGI